MPAGREILRGEIFHLRGDPHHDGPGAAEHFRDGILEIKDGRIVRCEPAQQSPRAQAEGSARCGGLIVPGFVDSHVHYPQLKVLASPGTDLLAWLKRYAFPAEAAFADPLHARREAGAFLDAMLAAGTTSALVFSTVHAHAANELFAAAEHRNLRLISGKTLMDRNAPPGLLDTAESAYRESAELIGKWHGRGRLGYAVTPRFAPTSSSAQLAAAGRLLADHPGVALHTHLCENDNEIAWVRELFPEAENYLDVYRRHGLVGRRSVFAHALHLLDSEWETLREAGASVAFCPMSNMFLGSGLFDSAKARALGVGFGLGSDVGGGNSLSLLRVMDEAYKTARLRGSGFLPEELWYHATLGGAKALGIDRHVGNFEPGKEADFLVLDPSAVPLLARRLSVANSTAERLFAIAMLGDERVVRETYVMGKKIYPTVPRDNPAFAN